VTPGEGTGAAPVGETRAPVGLSRWIVGTCPDCCGPIGGDTAIESELYIRSGVVFPFGGGEIAESLDTGWAIGGGGRILFLQDCGRRAWTVDLGILNMFNGAKAGVESFPFVDLRSIPGLAIPTVASVRSLNRTFVNATVGTEYYLMGQASGCGCGGQPSVRVGADAGVRYGTEKLVLGAPFRHENDVIYGALLAVHADVEMPTGCCTFLAGVRGEWDYTWSNIIGPENDADLQGINLLFNFGVRF
jgi:hypothetical protein